MVGWVLGEHLEMQHLVAVVHLLALTRKVLGELTAHRRPKLSAQPVTLKCVVLQQGTEYAAIHDG